MYRSSIGAAPDCKWILLIPEAVPVLNMTLVVPNVWQSNATVCHLRYLKTSSDRQDKCKDAITAVLLPKSAGKDTEQEWYDRNAEKMRRDCVQN